MIRAFLIVFFGVVSARAAESEFVAHSGSGKPQEGPLRELRADGSVVLEKGEIGAGDLISLRRPGQALPSLPAGPQLILTDGDRIPAIDVRLTGEQVRFRSPDLNDGKEICLPLARLAVYWREAPGGAGAEPTRRRLMTEVRKHDAVLLLNGEAVEGSLNGIGERAVEIEVERKRVTVELNRVAAVTLNGELADHTRPRGPYLRVALTGGTRLSLTKVACTDGTTLTGTTTFGVAVSVPLSRVAALDVFQGKAVYLSDLKPAKFESEAFLDVRWPLVADGCTSGRELRLNQGVYDKGLGTHPRCRVTYRLDGAYRRFEAVVGLDGRSGLAGSARVQVLLDGKPREIGELTGGGAPRIVALDVSGVKELTLVVDFGSRGDVQAHVNWADARLIRDSVPR